MTTQSYAALWCKSNYSFLEGASHPEELIDQAIALGIDTLAITDRNGVYGVVRAFSHTRGKNIRLLYGAQVTLDDESTLVLLAQTLQGYRHLCHLLTLGHARAPKGESRITLAEVCAHATDLIALWGGEASSIVCLPSEEDFDDIAQALKDAFGDRLYAMLARHHHEDQAEQEARLLQRAARYELALVASIEVLYHTPARQRLQDVLSCIRHHTTLAQAGRLLRPNHLHALVSPQDFTRRFQDVPEAIANTQRLAARCTFCVSQIHYAYPAPGLPAGVTPIQRLRTLSYAGAHKRYAAQIPLPVHAQLERELTIIERLGYAGYFLSMAEIVDFCRTRDILCQGRGSAANSLVCYCLEITAVDPVRMKLLFERFLSEERAEPPDIDLDIAHQRREEVIQHIYTTYGRERAALLANVVRFRPRSALRSVGEALGVDPAALDRLARATGRSHPPDAEGLRSIGLDPDTPQHQLLLELIDEILEFPRHLSIHPGGFLLANEAVHHIVPIEPATMEARTIVQWDKYDVEALGLFKLDLLGLGALTHLDKGYQLIRAHRGVELSMATLPTDDPATYAMLQKADSIGVFQVESRAQMAMLPRLRPRVFYDLVIQISLVRPGPISGDMVHPYLRRRSGQEKVEYPHPSLQPVLQKTLGVPLFQEQVMQLAVVAAGYTPGEADQLRRDMGAWRAAGRIEVHREKLITRMIQHGIEHNYAVRIFEQIRGFAEYGFPESHAASFALITYATAYMKCHYPTEFTCALLNAQPMGFYSAATIIEDAKRSGVRFGPLDVRHSQWDCVMQPSGDDFLVRMGFRYLKGMSESDWTTLERARRARPFSSLTDFLRRTQLNQRIARQLAEADAFRGFGLSQRDALWTVRGFRRDELPLFAHAEAVAASTLAHENSADTQSFDSATPTDNGSVFQPEEAPEFSALTPSDAIAWDYRTSFHSLRGHPMQPMRPELERRGYPTASELPAMPDGHWVHFIAMVICRQRPATASGVVFMTLEDETGLANLVVWPDVYQSYRIIARTQVFLGVSGRLQIQDGSCHIIAQRLWDPAALTQPLHSPAPTARSRDFR